LHEYISVKSCGTVPRKCVTYFWGRYGSAVNCEAQLPSVGGTVLPLEKVERVRSAELLKTIWESVRERGYVDLGEQEETDSLELLPGEPMPIYWSSPSKGLLDSMHVTFSKYTYYNCSEVLFCEYIIAI